MSVKSRVEWSVAVTYLCECFVIVLPLSGNFLSLETTKALGQSEEIPCAGSLVFPQAWSHQVIRGHKQSSRRHGRGSHCRYDIARGKVYHFFT